MNFNANSLVAQPNVTIAVPYTEMKALIMQCNNHLADDLESEHADSVHKLAHTCKTTGHLGYLHLPTGSENYAECQKLTL